MEKVSYSSFVPGVIFLLMVLGLTDCKKQGKEELIDPIETDTSALLTGGMLLDSVEYLKLPLISEPLINARVTGKGTLPDFYIIPYMPEAKNQWPYNSCTAWATAYAARSALYKKSTGISYKNADGTMNENAVFSPMFVYTSLNKGQNKGVYVYEALDLIQNSGVCKWADMPSIQAVTQTPDLYQKSQALPYKIKTWGRIQVDIRQIQNFVYFDIPVIANIVIDDNFAKPARRMSDGAFWWDNFDVNTSFKPGTKEPRAHTVVITGFDKGVNAFLIQNSWGTTWGKKQGEPSLPRNGCIWMEYNLLNTVVKEAYVMISNDTDKEPPVVETLAASDISNKEATLNGVIRDLGDTPLVNYGFLAGSDPEKLFYVSDANGNYTLHPGVKDIRDQKPFTPPYTYKQQYSFSGTGKIYFRAYGSSYQGIYYGKVQEFTPGAGPQPIADQISYVMPSVSTGDPHITTLDLARYSFMAAGEFVAVKSVTDKFEIQARQQEVPSKNNSGTVSFNTGLAINTGNDRVCIYPPNRLLVNGKAVAMDFDVHKLQNNGVILLRENVLHIETPGKDDIEIRLFQRDLDYYVTLNPTRKGKVKGLLGNFDGNYANDLVTSSGQPVLNSYEALYPAFADGWRIRQAESLFSYDSGKNTDSYTDKSFPKAKPTLTGSQLAWAKSICEQAGVTDPVVLQNCILDVGLTNDERYAQRAHESEINYGLTQFSMGDFRKFTGLLKTEGNTKISGTDVTLGAGNFLNSSSSISLIPPFDASRGYEMELKVIFDTNIEERGYLFLVAEDELKGSKMYKAMFQQYIGLYISSPYMFDYGNWYETTHIFDGKEHTLKMVVSRQRVADGTEEKITIYVDDAEPVVHSFPNVGKFNRNTVYPQLWGIGIKVSGWTMKSL